MTDLKTFDQCLDDLDARLLRLSTEISKKQARLEAELSVLDNLEASFAKCQLINAVPLDMPLPPEVEEAKARMYKADGRDQ